MVSSRIYVGDLRAEVRKEDLEREFSKCGRVVDVWIARNPPGFAFLEFDNPKDADGAVRSLDGKTVCGSRVRVELSRGRGGGGGRGGRDRDRGSRGDRGPAMRPFSGPPRGPLPPPPGGYRDYPSDYNRFESRYDEPRSRWSDNYGSSWGSRSSPPTGYRSRSPVRRRSPPTLARGRDPREYSRDYQDYGRDYPQPQSRYGSSRYDRPTAASSSYDRTSYDRPSYDRPSYDRPARSPPRR